MNTKVFTTSVIYLFVVCLKTSERQKMFLYFFNEFSKKKPSKNTWVFKGIYVSVNVIKFYVF